MTRLILPEHYHQRDKKHVRMVPVEWAQDGFTEFLDQVRDNQVATFARKKLQFEKIREIDDLFCEIGTQLNDPQHVLSPFFVFRSHSGFRAGAACAMAGQQAEAFILSRASLENASYGHFMHGNTELTKIWLKRHDDAKSRSLVRKRFNHGDIVAAITTKDSKLGSVYSALYDEAIDFGAHPNERGLTSNMRKTELKGQTKYDQIYLHGDGVSMDRGLRHMIRSGVCCLHIFARMFPERFEIVGLVPRLRALRPVLKEIVP